MGHLDPALVHLPLALSRWLPLGQRAFWLGALFAFFGLFLGLFGFLVLGLFFALFGFFVFLGLFFGLFGFLDFVALLGLGLFDLDFLGLFGLALFDLDFLALFGFDFGALPCQQFSMHGCLSLYSPESLFEQLWILSFTSEVPSGYGLVHE